MNIHLDRLFELLNTKAKMFRITKYKKERNRKLFIEKIKNANSNIHLFGLKFPNYITTSNDKIHKALKELDMQGSHIKVYIYKPSLNVIYQINKLNIYKEKYHTRDICKIDDFKNDFKNLNIKVIEYNKLYKIGLSAIDLGTSNAYIHLSQVKENEFIKDAEYFDINYSPYMSIFIDMINKFLKELRD
jgi:hypothetical protein